MAALNVYCNTEGVAPTPHLLLLGVDLQHLLLGLGDGLEAVELRGVHLLLGLGLVQRRLLLGELRLVLLKGQLL